jgi:hypothetical protein
VSELVRDTQDSDSEHKAYRVDCPQTQEREVESSVIHVQAKAAPSPAGFIGTEEVRCKHKEQAGVSNWCAHNTRTTAEWNTRIAAVPIGSGRGRGWGRVV